VLTPLRKVLKIYERSANGGLIFQFDGYRQIPTPQEELGWGYRQIPTPQEELGW
jgi:hypothetical protein